MVEGRFLILLDGFWKFGIVLSIKDVEVYLNI